ncbi:MAG: hypothetical protein ACK5MT_04185 [Actinomycetales bacterium]
MSFTIEARSPLPVLAAWRAVTDWPAHGAQVPLTTVESTPQGLRARTRVPLPGGRGLVVDDPMRITEWAAPEAGRDAKGRCVLVKIGRLVRGWAVIEVLPDRVGDNRIGRDAAQGATASPSRVRWTEQIHLGPRILDRVTGPVIDVVAGPVFARVVRHLLGDGATVSSGRTRAGAHPSGTPTSGALAGPGGTSSEATIRETDG